MAERPTGTNLSLLPFPITRMKPRSGKMQEILNPTTSLTRRPQLYITSSIALFLVPSGLLRSIAEMMDSISPKLSTSGNFLFSLGVSSKSAGSFLRIFSRRQYLKKERIPETILDCELGVMPRPPIHLMNC